ERVDGVLADDRCDLLCRERRGRLIGRGSVGVRADVNGEGTLLRRGRVRADACGGRGRLVRVGERTDRQRESLGRGRPGLDRGAAVDRRSQARVGGHYGDELAHAGPTALDAREQARQHRRVAAIGIRERVAREIRETVGEGDETITCGTDRLDRRGYDLRRVRRDQRGLCTRDAREAIRTHDAHLLAVQPTDEGVVVDGERREDVGRGVGDGEGLRVGDVAGRAGLVIRERCGGASGGQEDEDRCYRSPSCSTHQGLLLFFFLRVIVTGVDDQGLFDRLCLVEGLAARAALCLFLGLVRLVVAFVVGIPSEAEEVALDV